MSKEIDEDLIYSFLLDSESTKKHYYIADEILTDEGVRKTYEKIKEFIDIERYNNDEMSLHENLEFEIKLKKNPELEQDRKLSKNIDEVLRQEALFNKSFAKKEKEELLEEQLKQERLTRLRFKKKIIRWVSAAAAFVVLSIMASSITDFRFKHNAIENKLFAEYYESHAENELFILNNNKTNSQFNYGIESDMLESLCKTNTLESQKQLLVVGINLMHKRKYSEAISVLFELYHNKNFTDIALKSVVGWHLGMCYLKEQRIAEATVILRYVANCKTFKSEEAKEILEKLEKAKS